MTIAVERAGFVTTVQDLGRAGHRMSGVSLGGALDRHALQVANLLVGNLPGSAGLEFTAGNARLRFADNRVLAWCGGAFDVRVGETRVPSGRAARVEAGEAITIAARGGRAWLAVSGGVDVALVLGSRSTDLRSGFGGFEGRALRDGDVLPLGRSRSASELVLTELASTRLASWSAPNEWSSTARRHPFLRLIAGPDRELFSHDAFDLLIHQPFTVLPDSDRMGVRLEGPMLERRAAEDLVSEAVAPGTIQVPPDGRPIILLGDCQTIGGYPKIGHVITVDLAAAAQLQPGDVLRFVETTIVDAQRALAERERELAFFRAGIELRTRCR